MPEPKMRMLNLKLPSALDDYVEQDGGLLVKNVKILAPGTWTDSAVRLPLYYTPKALATYATNWVANGYWARHYGGVPRNLITDKLGDVRDIRFDANVDNGPELERGAIMGSVFYHKLTTSSRDGAELALGMAKAGTPLAVSVEHGGDTVYNAERQREETATLVFGGLAAVDQGACVVCGLPGRRNEAESVENKGENEMEADELKKMFADFGAELKASIITDVDAKFAAFAPKPDEAAKAALEASAKATKELEQRIKALEMDPKPKSRMKPEGEEHELESEPAGPRVVCRGGKVYRED